MLRFFLSPQLGQALVRNEREISFACCHLGYFGFVGNVDVFLQEALAKYRRRNDVEVAFKLMFQNLLSSPRVHSTRALDGLLMTTFVG